MRYRQAQGLFGLTLAPNPSRLEASAVALLALDRYGGEGHFGDGDPIEAIETALGCQIEGDQSSQDLMLHNLLSCHQRLRESIAWDWSGRTEPIEGLHAHLATEMPRLRAAILVSPPAYSKGVCHLLAESGTANVVWLSPHRSP